jgi:hypothetical protein
MPFIFEAIGLGNGTLVESFCILVTTIIHVPGVIELPWNVMPTTPHTTPKAHKIQLVGSKSFVLDFMIVCKHVQHNTYQTIVKGVQHVHDSMKIQQSINLNVEMKHIIQITCASEDLNLQVGDTWKISSKWLTTYTNPIYIPLHHFKNHMPLKASIWGAYNQWTALKFLLPYSRFLNYKY